MKFLVVLATAIGLVAAQNLDGLPACATDCIVKAVAAVGCQPTDIGCQCSADKQAAMTKEAAPCMLKACQPNDLIKAQSAGAAQCSSYSAGVKPTDRVDNASGTTASTTGTAGAAAPTSSSTAGAAAAMITPAAFVMGVLGAMAM
ncbi:hypothetical protein QBC35DRAFT_492370 [Podospora australis]|uniref:CFEM domain-containing protein n=1 Tax=Podospora australis TaxID=1536484 RepID=A0AAN7AID4_9PEZI|nr:hypothetical protein QBC35DRAFT_492370 [Podospora australis]